ncbi:MAG: PASTA domain-containing protein [Acidobacteria bacterium]|nr:PASTA domain-containing protein [Acidobacteriota bacterium]
MPVFNANVPITTDAPTIEVEALPPGRHRFQLVVVDDSGNRSQPDAVVVTVVAATNLVVVPSVLQMTASEAKRTLDNAGLVLSIADRVQSNNQPADMVLRQTPIAGSRAERGSTVRVVISTSAGVIVPRVIGQNVEEAKGILDRVGLGMNVTAQVPMPGVARGLVLTQRPLPAQPAARGDVVDVTISRRLVG